MVLARDGFFRSMEECDWSVKTSVLGLIYTVNFNIPATFFNGFGRLFIVILF
jgi:hypothetical protein